MNDKFMLSSGEIISVTGHKMLVRKNLLNEGNFILDAETRDVRGELPAHLAIDVEQLIASKCAHSIVNTCEVLAVGPECGKPRDDADMKKLNGDLRAMINRGELEPVPRCLNNPSKPGDFVLIPECSARGRFWRGALGNPYELFIDECELIAIIPSEELA